MTTRIEDVPVFASRADLLDAPVYNLWRRARQRYGSPLRMALPGLKEMALILEDDAWVVIDQRQYDMPVLAWVDFKTHGRDALHEPVACTLNYYHFMASQLRGKVLDLMQQDLERRLRSVGDSE